MSNGRDAARRGAAHAGKGARAQGIAKTQDVRRLDMVVLAPLMIWSGVRLARVDKASMLGPAMIAAGAATFFYNLANYDKQEKATRKENA